MFVFLFVGISLIFIVIKFLNLFDSPDKPKIYHSQSKFVQDVLTRCNSFHKIYEPPTLWGKSGHIQTAVYGKIGRWDCPNPSGRRYIVSLQTGETISYDVFQPTKQNQFAKCCTILVCPGICNSSEKKYIRTFIQYAVDLGYRVAVLNHIGVIPSVKLTSPKIFTYGDTKYFARMAEDIKKVYPDSSTIIVGFSMGGNIIVKYLGENPDRQRSVICAVSMCQGYHGIRSTTPMTQGYRRFYNYMITMNFKKILRPHWKDLFHLHENHAHFGTSKSFDEKKVASATCLRDIEDGLLRHFDGYADCHEYMRHCGCEDSIDNISLPILLVNSEDDPLIVTDVHDIPRSHIERNENALFVTTKHGGHLGFYQGSWFRPKRNTLVEEYVMEYVEAVLDIKFSQKKCD